MQNNHILWSLSITGKHFKCHWKLWSMMLRMVFLQLKMFFLIAENKEFLYFLTQLAKFQTAQLPNFLLCILDAWDMLNNGMGSKFLFLISWWWDSNISSLSDVIHNRVHSKQHLWCTNLFPLLKKIFLPAAFWSWSPVIQKCVPAKKNLNNQAVCPAKMPVTP